MTERQPGTDEHALIESPQNDPLPSVAPPAPPAPKQEHADLVDSDLRELERLEAELGVDGENEPPAGANAGDDANDGSRAPAQPRPAAGKKPDGQTVPLARFQELTAKLQKANNTNLYLAGRASALEEQLAGRPEGDASGKPGEPAAPPAKATDPRQDQITAKLAAIDALADKFDSGEITLKQFNRERDALQTEVEDLRFEIRSERLRPAQGNTPGLADETILHNHLADLHEQNPILGHISEAEMTRLAKIAMAAANEEGNPYRKGDPRDAMRLREEVADLAYHYLPKWNAGKQYPARRAASNPGGAAPPQDPAALARRRELDAGRQHPTDINNLGPTGRSGVITTADVERMSERDLERLPEAEIDRLLASTS